MTIALIAFLLILGIICCLGCFYIDVTESEEVARPPSARIVLVESLPLILMVRRDAPGRDADAIARRR